MESSRPDDRSRTAPATRLNPVMSTHAFDDLQRELPRRYMLEREIARTRVYRVYLARENRPERPVVITVVDRRLALGERDRLLREMDFNSQLSHPHIVPVFAAGEVGEALYYVTPYIDGETLEARIARERSLPLDQAVRITLDLSRALQYAHDRGVVHRDVAPANIRFQDGQPLLADFGIARVLGEADREPPDEDRSPDRAGGPGPEERGGGQDGVARSDQYALASVLFEMLTGEPPVPGPDPCRYLRERRPEVDIRVQSVLERALRGRPADRYPSVAEFAAALGEGPVPGVESDARPSAPQGGAPGWRRIAGAAVLLALFALVLVPLLRSDPEVEAGDAYLTSVAVLAPRGQAVGASPGLDPDELGEALAGEIITALTGVPWLDVRSFYSVRAVQKANLTVPRLLDTLRVEHLIQVNLTLQGERIGVQVGYLDENDRQLQGPREEIRVGDWLDAQPRIAAAVARDFAGRFGADDGGTGVRAPARPGAGQRDFLNGNRFLGRRTPAEIGLAIESYWRAIEKDPSYGPAYARLSSAYALALTYRYDVGMDGYAQAGLAHALASRAIEEDPASAEGYAARSYLRALAAAPTELAAADIERARTLEPNNPSVPSWSARIHTLQGDLDEAYREVLRGALLDPMHSGRQIAVAYQAFHVGRYEKAVEYADIALELEPGLMLPRVIKARSLVLLDRPRACLAMDLGPYEGTRALCLWAAGSRDVARAMVEALSDARGRGPAVGYTPVITAEDLAVFHGYTGNAAEALRWIRAAYDRSPAGLELRVLESALFDPVRDSPRFRETVERRRSALWGQVTEAWRGPVQRPDGGA